MSSVLAGTWKPATAVRAGYVKVLFLAFSLFSAARVFAYLPNLWAICEAADSSQQSLLTWMTWFGSHVTMAAMVIHKTGRVDSTALVSVINASMCLGTAAIVAWFRIF